MKVLVVDDEAPARRRLVRMLERIAGVQVVGEADDGLAALRLIGELRPDVVLLDVHMPELDGIELAETTAELPAIVFVTAHPDYAVRAFAVAAQDYLLKPVQQQRLEQALARVEARAASARQATPVRISARAGDSVRLFDPRSITRFHAADKYTVFRVGDEEHVLDDSLNTLEDRLGGLEFLRVHRSELVNLLEVRTLHQRDGTAVLELSDGQRAHVSRRTLAEVKRRLGLRDGDP
ncbi:LytR/AlgR family response regulator transcription factor [Nannocystis radixulma]|uniref:LytTR family DNA-binding domain-containing protein n=1 Tax=Nannocystis radixulma TaxID=2995305 RepID=A0ABT5BDQ2_9BACT|nr:LytTR family DNA-binding domain-containing protein [Nannocystis radixulma]MDC0672289.1 LytTR family DNA-binding domain-containing protein [Nannocystis radixulma]